jgi:cold shock protein
MRRPDRRYREHSVAQHPFCAHGQSRPGGRTWRGPDREKQQERDMPIGTVKFFNTAKGFGFIQPEDGSRDVFVHISAVQAAGLQTLREGDRVSFDVTSERGKPAAANLKPA